MVLQCGDCPLCAAVAGGIITTHARIIFRICSVFTTIICNEQPGPHHSTTPPPPRWIKTCLNTRGGGPAPYTGTMAHIPTSLQQQHTASTTATASQQQQQGHVRADHHQHDSLLVLLLVLVCSGCGGVVVVASSGFCDGNLQQFQLPQQKPSIVFSSSIERDSVTDSVSNDMLLR